MRTRSPTLESGDGLYRRAEVCYIQTTTQPFRKSRFHEFDDQILSLLADIHAHLVVGQRNYNAASTFSRHDGSPDL